MIEVRPRIISTDSLLEPKLRTEAELELPPLLSLTLTTNLNGAFTETIRIPWDIIVESPECLEMIFPEKRRNKQSNISSVRLRRRVGIVDASLIIYLAHLSRIIRKNGLSR